MMKPQPKIRADKIATVHTSIFVRKLGILPNDLVYPIQLALKEALNL